MNTIPEPLKSGDYGDNLGTSHRKRQKFKELAEKRTNKAITAIKVIGNLSNRNSYHYKDEEVKNIIKALRAAVSEVEGRFLKPEKEGSGNFVL